MRKRTSIIIVWILALGIIQSASAQQKSYLPPAPPRDTSKFWIFKDMTVGPYFTAGVTRQNENLPLGWTSKPKFANTFGLTLDASVTSWFGIDLTALYDTRNLYADSIGNSIDLRLGYIALQPSIRIFWLLVGLSFDFPMSGSAAVQPYIQNLNVATTDIAPLTEIRVAISVPLLEQENATLHFIVSGSYPLSKTMLGTSSFDTSMHFSGKSAPGQGPLPSIEAGITYQFDILH